MWIHDDLVLHSVHEGTNLSFARFLSGKDAKAVWKTFLKARSHTYTGFPDSILYDQGSLFNSEYWKTASQNAQIDLKNTKTESHNSRGKR